MPTPESPVPAYDEPQDAQANVDGSLLHQKQGIRDEHPDDATTTDARQLSDQVESGQLEQAGSVDGRDPLDEGLSAT